jgi:hypothetical protein
MSPSWLCCGLNVLVARIGWNNLVCRSGSFSLAINVKL